MGSLSESDDASELLHVLDLPQLYEKPTAQVLLHTLKTIALENPTLETSHHNKKSLVVSNRQVDRVEFARYLTSIIASRLTWMNESEKEQVWNTAAARLSEQSGETAMSDRTEIFKFPIDDTTYASFKIRSPGITEDNLGHKIWPSTHVMGGNLNNPNLKALLPHSPKVLELGSGVGLLGLAAATIWEADCTLTDMRSIVDNLAYNVDANRKTVELHGGKVSAHILEWDDEGSFPKNEDERYSVVLGADLLYSEDHAILVSNMIDKWLCHSPDAVAITAFPERDGYETQLETFREKMWYLGFQVIGDRSQWGVGDAKFANGESQAFLCHMKVWKRKEFVCQSTDGPEIIERNPSETKLTNATIQIFDTENAGTESPDPLQTTKSLCSSGHSTIAASSGGASPSSGGDSELELEDLTMKLKEAELEKATDMS
ncbi:MAG: hypothetical protein M1834_005683 [Cirrosporium novae-zelandiae]|nr:MAG: hypothetical protein M1834_005683 [Cirrosporium novae-zelandiae]